VARGAVQPAALASRQKEPAKLIGLNFQRLMAGQTTVRQWVG